MDEQHTTTTGDTSAPAAVAEKPKKGPGNGRRRRNSIILILLVATGCIVGTNLWVRGQTHISTDNAFIESHVHAVSSRVPGMVSRVLVADNQPVHKGDLLAEIDDADYRTRAATAEAELAMAKNETSGEYATVEAARAAAHQAAAQLDQVNLDLTRGKALFAKEVISREQLDRLETSRKVATARLKEAEEAVHRAEAMLGIAGSGSREARIAKSRAELEASQLDLSYTRIYAPADGYVTRKSVETGNYVQPGQPLLAIVALDKTWVTANYKEKQLTYVKPGQQVEFTVDAYPGKTFKGTVDSIMAGTGAAFSLLPPENATGNYVKVVQRIPVKIAIDKSSDPDRLLRVGMSVEPTILTGRKLGDVLAGLNPF